MVFRTERNSRDENASGGQLLIFTGDSGGQRTEGWKDKELDQTNLKGTRSKTTEVNNDVVCLKTLSADQMTWPEAVDWTGG